MGGSEWQREGTVGGRGIGGWGGETVCQFIDRTSARRAAGTALRARAAALLM